MTNRSAKARVEEIIRSRGPDYQRLIQLRRELERLRKRQARKQQTPEQLEHERARKREARGRQTPQQREYEKEREARRDRATDEWGRQNYFLMLASDQPAGEKYIPRRKGKPLSPRDCLEFILSLPAD